MSNDLPPIDGEVIEKINKEDLKPLYDTNHEHIYEADPDDVTDDYYAQICTVKGCNIGRLIAKT